MNYINKSRSWQLGDNSGLLMAHQQVMGVVGGRRPDSARQY
jgi:hypothetical protein